MQDTTGLIRALFSGLTSSFTAASLVAMAPPLRLI
jgi:hypothetical protein